MDGDATPRRWRFGQIEVDEREARLSVDGRTVTLDRSGFDLLLCLLHHADTVVSKDELLRAGWPGRVVTENSLTKAVGRLRQAINDPNGECLRVVHGYGYRLVAPLQQLETAQPNHANDGISPPRKPAPALASPKALPSRRPAWLLAAIGVALALAAISTVRIGFRPAEPSAAVVPATSAPASIAVLPFVDLSENHDQGYFSDGLAEQLLDDLARLPQLRVAARTSSFAFRGKDTDIPGIGRQLNVGTLLQGSVRKSGEHVRVTAQLINTVDGYQLWSETYDRPMGELFALQDEIARAIVGALRIELLPQQSKELVRHRTRSPQAWEQYLLAHNVFQDDETAHRRSIAAYERAVALDPEFTDAWLALADLLGFSGMYADSAEEALAGKQRAREIVDHVLSLEPDNVQALITRGTHRYAHWWDWSGAAADFAHAAALQPSNDHLLLERARLAAAQGHLTDAIALDRRAGEVEPSTGNAWTVLAYHYLGMGDFVRSREAGNLAVRREPLDEHAHYYLGLGELLQGHAAAALPYFEDSAHVLRLTGQALAHHALGDGTASERDVQLLITRYGHILPYNIAEVYAWRGENDKAFHWLDRAVELHDASFMYLKFDPLLANLHADARFAALLAKLNLPPLEQR